MDDDEDDEDDEDDSLAFLPVRQLMCMLVPEIETEPEVETQSEFSLLRA